MEMNISWKPQDAISKQPLFLANHAKQKHQHRTLAG